MLSQEVCTLVSDLFKHFCIVLDLAKVVGLYDAIDFRQVLRHLRGLLLEVVGGHVLLDLLVEVKEHEVVDHGIPEGIEAVLEAAGDFVSLLGLGLRLFRLEVLRSERQFLDLLL